MAEKLKEKRYGNLHSENLLEVCIFDGVFVLLCLDKL